MTLTDLLADVCRRVNQDAAPPAAVTTRLTAFVNKWHRKILSDARFTALRQDTYALTTTSGTATYGLPPIIARINRIVQRSNNVVLGEQSLDWYRLVDPGLTASGGPAARFILTGQQQVQRQPADASAIFVDSTSASDTGTAYLEGYRTSGFPTTLSIVMTGTTAVSVSATITDLIAITKFYLSAPAVGTVTLHEDASGGTELARIPIGQRYARYLGIAFWPTPAGEVYHLDITRTIADLVQATDEPLLPADFHWLLASGAEYEEHRTRDDSRRSEVRAEIEQGIRDLNTWVNNPPSYRPTSGGRGEWPSRLGAAFPSGT